MTACVALHTVPPDEMTKIDGTQRSAYLRYATLVSIVSSTASSGYIGLDFPSLRRNRFRSFALTFLIDQLGPTEPQMR